MPDQSAAPALSDVDLRKTLDLLSAVIASVSDRMDSQTQAIDRLIKTAVETWQVAFAAKVVNRSGAVRRTSWEADWPQRGPVEASVELVSMLAEEIQRVAALNLEHQATRKGLMKSIRREKVETERWEKRILFIAIFGLVLVLGLGVGLPRFLVAHGTACAVLGSARRVMFKYVFSHWLNLKF